MPLHRRQPKPPHLHTVLLFYNSEDTDTIPALRRSCSQSFNQCHHQLALKHPRCGLKGGHHRSRAQKPRGYSPHLVTWLQPQDLLLSETAKLPALGSRSVRYTGAGSFSHAAPPLQGGVPVSISPTVAHRCTQRELSPSATSQETAETASPSLSPAIL